jgi:hypothetical protein
MTMCEIVPRAWVIFALQRVAPAHYSSLETWKVMEFDLSLSMPGNSLDFIPGNGKSWNFHIKEEKKMFFCAACVYCLCSLVLCVLNF